MSAETNHHVNIRLSIARHGRGGWQWTMLLTTDDDAITAAAEFRSDENGRGTWMRMIGDADWVMVTAPEQRAYPGNEADARSEITEVCLGAVANLVGQMSRPGALAGGCGDLARMDPMGAC